MIFNLKILPDFKLCLVGYSGPINARSLDKGWKPLIAAREQRLSFDDLIVLAPDADYSEITPEETTVRAQRLIELYRNSRQQPQKRSAYLCSTPMQLAMTRLYKALIDADAPAVVALQNFTNLDAALDWLQAGKPDCSLDYDLVKVHLREIGQGWCCGTGDRLDAGWSSGELAS